MNIGQYGSLNGEEKRLAEERMARVQLAADAARLRARVAKEKANAQ